MHTVKEENKRESFDVVKDGWMRAKKNKVRSCQKVEIIETINVMTVCGEINDLAFDLSKQFTSNRIIQLYTVLVHA